MAIGYGRLSQIIRSQSGNALKSDSLPVLADPGDGLETGWAEPEQRAVRPRHNLSLTGGAGAGKGRGPETSSLRRHFENDRRLGGLCREPFSADRRVPRSLADVLARQCSAAAPTSRGRPPSPRSREWLDAPHSKKADAPTTVGNDALGGWAECHSCGTINSARQKKRKPTRGTMRALIVPAFANIAAIAGCISDQPATYGGRTVLG